MWRDMGNPSEATRCRPARDVGLIVRRAGGRRGLNRNAGLAVKAATHLARWSRETAEKVPRRTKEYGLTSILRPMNKDLRRVRALFQQSHNYRWHARRRAPAGPRERHPGVTGRRWRCGGRDGGTVVGFGANGSVGPRQSPMTPVARQGLFLYRFPLGKGHDLSSVVQRTTSSIA